MFIRLVCLLLALFQTSATLRRGSPLPGAYLLTSFDGANNDLNLQWSNDMVNWWGVDPFPSMPTHERDASIAKIGSKYCVVFTGAGLVAVPPGANTAFWYSCTSNLVYWPAPQSVSVAEITGACSPNPTNCQVWAPEFVRNADGTFYDDGSGFPWISVTICLNYTSGLQQFSAYVKHATASDLSTWSNAVLLSGVASSEIDSEIVSTGGAFYIWYRNFTANPTDCLEYASSSTLTGTYTQIGTGNWAGWGCLSQEGPVLINKSGTWYLLSDLSGGNTSAGQMNYSTSTNWPGAGAASTWTVFKPLNTPVQAKHGTIIRFP